MSVAQGMGSWNTYRWITWPKVTAKTTARQIPVRTEKNVCIFFT